MKKVKIGFIGIGLMGFPMAKNLLKSKYEVKVFNRTKNKAIRLKKFGAKVCNSLKEVVTDQDLIITMLSAVSYTHLRAHETPEHRVLRGGG